MSVLLKNALACLWLSALATGMAHSEEMGPLKLVEVSVQDVVADMNANQKLYAEEPEKLTAMVYERVVPYFNVGRMTQLALGSHWKDATPGQRREIRDSVIDMLVHTYAHAMFEFRNAPIRLLDERETGSRGATVRLSVTNTNSGKPVSVILRMEKREKGWQVIDVVVDGVSMIITYRGIFAEEISRSGIDGLIASIKQDRLQRDLQ